MIPDLVACLGGTVVLVVATNHFMPAPVRSARVLSMSPVVIGAVVLGTSLPALMTTVAVPEADRPT